MMLGHYLALKPEDVDEPIDGIETVEPTFGLPALWIAEADREKAELKGYTTIDVPSVISTHLMEVIKRHADELLGRQQVQTIIDNLKKQQPALVEEVVPKMFTIGEVQKVLANLLREGVSSRHRLYLEDTGRLRHLTHDTDVLRNTCAEAEARHYQKLYPGRPGAGITINPKSKRASGSVRPDKGGGVAIEPAQMQRFLASLKKGIDHFLSLGISPMVITSPMIRRQVKNLSAQVFPELVVLSYNELEPNVEILSDWTVTF